MEEMNDNIESLTNTMLFPRNSFTYEHHLGVDIPSPLKNWKMPQMGDKNNLVFHLFTVFKV